MYSVKCKEITGRWYKGKYKIIKPIGSGGVGEIYLANHENRGLVALKVTKSMMSITKEYDAMKKYEGKDYIPAVYELDDFEIHGEIYHYFAMEYIEGYDLTKVMKGSLPLKLKIDIFIIILQIIADINDEGLIYSDLKHENIMVDERNLTIRLVDFGSLTQLGKGVKEYTPLYDRYSWGLGTRAADISYQTFGAAMLLMTLLVGRKLTPDKDKIRSVIEILIKDNIPKTLIDLIEKVLQGDIIDCRTFLINLRKIDLSAKDKVFRINPWLDSIIAILVFLLGVMLIRFKALTPFSLF